MAVLFLCNFHKKHQTAFNPSFLCNLHNVKNKTFIDHKSLKFVAKKITPPKRSWFLICLVVHMNWIEYVSTLDDGVLICWGFRIVWQLVLLSDNMTLGERFWQYDKLSDNIHILVNIKSLPFLKVQYIVS